MSKIDEIDLFSHTLRQINREGGPRPEHRPRIAGSIAEVAERLRRDPSIRERLDAVMANLAPFASRDTIIGISWMKPHGYAGDFEVIDRMHTGHCADEPLLAAWDRFTHTLPGPRAVRERARYMHGLVDRAMRTDGPPLRVLDLASGPCRDVADYLCERPEAPVHFTCMDLDRNAIAHARTVVGEDARVRFVHGDAREIDNNERYDIIWSAGLFDYFDDAMFIRVLERLWRILTPGGRLVVGNFCASETTRDLMDILDWPLYRRSAPHLEHLALAAGVPTERIHVDIEPTGVNLLLRCER